jgi:hypothetical protein
VLEFIIPPFIEGSHSNLTTAGHHMRMEPEAANKVRAPDDERYAARNMLSLQWTIE